MDIHLAFIPDGNRRWALKNRVPIQVAYEAGIAKIREIVEHYANTRRVKYLTFYVLSLENIKNRSKIELDILYRLLIRELRKVREDPKIYEKGVRIRVIGVKEILPSEVQEEIRLTEEATMRNSNCIVNLAVAYGGVAEPVHVVFRKVRSQGKISVLEELISSSGLEPVRYMPDVPEPLAVIRTGGEVRISNFLIPYIVGTRLIILRKYWPEITIQDIESVLDRLLGNSKNSSG